MPGMQELRGIGLELFQAARRTEMEFVAGMHVLEARRSRVDVHAADGILHRAVAGGMMTVFHSSVVRRQGHEYDLTPCPRGKVKRDLRVVREPGRHLDRGREPGVPAGREGWRRAQGARGEVISRGRGWVCGTRPHTRRAGTGWSVPSQL